jgi:hypothetical protein
VLDTKTETWFFSVVDVVAALTDSVNPRDYWFKMKIRVKNEDGFEPSTVCRQFKMRFWGQATILHFASVKRSRKVDREAPIH